MKKTALLLTTLLWTVLVGTVAQTRHHINGTVIDRKTRLPLEFVNVVIEGTSQGSTTDSLGRFRIPNVNPGIYKLQASTIGYHTVTTPDYQVTNKDLTVNIELEENTTQLEGVTVTASPFRRDLESPVGLRVIGLQEIEKSPGANRDISRVVQSYPGVAFSPAGYRNDLIVRGGSPSENRFYLDGVEIPNINHFSTQGASGGPVGLINADFIREVNFYTGSFPANRENSLSSVLDFRLKDGDMEHNSVKATLGASEVSLASNGHIGKKTSYLVSVRQSYLQFLFDLLGLPFLPTFTDAQFKLKTRIDTRNEVTLLGLGGIDNMKLNTSLTDEKSQYLLSYLPKIQQETFTLGAVYRHYAGAHLQTVTVSHSYLNNRNTKYRNNDETLEDNLTLKIRSIEQSTRLRIENTSNIGHWKLSGGANMAFSHYDNNSFQKVFIENQGKEFDYRTRLGMWHWGLFATMAYAADNDRYTASFGVRADACNFSTYTNRLRDQLSPRLSLSWRLTDQLYLSGNAGLYFQLPPYTALGFKDNQDRLVNSQLRYMRVTQESVGLSWRPARTLEVSVEGFYKFYDRIPLSVADNIPLLCKGNDYGVVGNEELTSTAQGRAYGLEIMGKWLIAARLNLGASVTLYKSEYRNNAQSAYLPSAWDNGFIVNASGTYQLPKNWSVGLKISAIGGAPYTPYDEDKSSLVTAWNAQGRPYADYTRYNSERLPAYGQLDIRIDKSFYFRKCMLGCYVDIQNVTNSKYKPQDVLMSTGVIANPEAPAAEQRYIMKRVDQTSGVVLPTIGITFEY